MNKIRILENVILGGVFYLISSLVFKKQYILILISSIPFVTSIVKYFVSEKTYKNFLSKINKTH